MDGWTGCSFPGALVGGGIEGQVDGQVVVFSRNLGVRFLGGYGLSVLFTYSGGCCIMEIAGLVASML